MKIYLSSYMTVIRNIEGGGDQDVNYVAGFEASGFGEVYAEWDASDPATVLNGSGLPASNTETVATWVDRSGHGLNLTQSDNNYRPIYNTNVLNGKAVLTFDGTDDLLNFPTGVFDQRDCATAVIVYKTNTVEFFKLITAFTVGGITASFMVGSTADGQWIFDQTREGGAGTQKYSGALKTMTAGTWYGLITLCDYSQDVGGMWNKTEELIALSPQDGFGWAGAQAVSGNFFGTYNDYQSGNLNGQIAHCIIYSSPLSSTQRTALFASLEAKWGTLA